MKKYVKIEKPKHSTLSNIGRFILIYADYVGIKSPDSANQVYWVMSKSIDRDAKQEVVIDGYAKIRVLGYPEMSYITMCDDEEHFQEFVRLLRGKVIESYEITDKEFEAMCTLDKFTMDYIIEKRCPFCNVWEWYEDPDSFICCGSCGVTYNSDEFKGYEKEREEGKLK